MDEKIVKDSQGLAKDLVNDTISRQAAIDEITEYGSGNTTYMSVAELKRRIEQLPSAQPDIIRCKDCKHWTNNIGDSKLRDNYCNDEAHGFYYQCSEDDYCSFAERRTDG